ncbi:hypothetical protein NN3_28520 [Nocardia neocaledoniensis NBRC 108232]|uniref:DNA-binding transcriptional MerR regulator n=1 Tax=Nocardia neocaledoniensis TaxID=236511 RepID=A0A317NB64_9NOCA|nr:MerR family transcriptional regulator [Nocardia neocaledoniensis]PWV72300.1 DNA-binding transcriptional MerR regulator [Nocardia neocaledoniensis]GEM31845.1 hypothetical protein NN3_28520 [Nocardia neocaledoniensis NBRC 108232]
MPEHPIRIGELASRAQVSTRTVDYYTSQGLLSPVERTASGYRLYDPSDVDRITLVKQLESQGLSLDEITTAFAGDDADTAARLARLQTDLRTLQAAIDVAPTALQGLLAVIAGRVHGLVAIALQIPPDIPIL